LSKIFDIIIKLISLVLDFILSLNAKFDHLNFILTKRINLFPLECELILPKESLFLIKKKFNNKILGYFKFIIIRLFSNLKNLIKIFS
jgi:hypothetical protein